MLQSVQLSDVAYFDVSMRSAWVAETPARERAARVLPGAQHVMELLVAVDGSYTTGIAGEPSLRIEPGDVVLFPRGDAHMLRSARRTREDETGARHAPTPLSIPSRDGAEGMAEVCLLGGFWACDVRPFHPLVTALPRVIVDTRGRDGSDGFFGTLVRRVVTEARAKRRGAGLLLTKLSELMFIEVVRRYLDGLRGDPPGWLAALRDPMVGRAIALLHQRPAEEWSVDALARACGVSRTVLAERFTHHVGMPPMQYLMRWRMQISAGMLERSNLKVATIAAEVGYESEAAFHRTFKRVMGESPGSYRRRSSRGGAASRRDAPEA